MANGNCDLIGHDDWPEGVCQLIRAFGQIGAMACDAPKAQLPGPALPI